VKSALRSLVLLSALVLLLVLLAGLGFGRASWAATPVDNAFTARGMPMDVTGSSPAQAREKAFADVLRPALRKVLERLVASADYSRLPNLSKGDLEQALRDIAVDQEKSLGQRYVAQLTVRFQPAAIRKLLNNAGIAFAEPMTQPVLVAPLYRSAADQPILLWEQTNPLRDAFGQPGEGLVSFVVPAADKAGDLLDAAHAMTGDREALGLLASRFGTGDALVLLAQGHKTPDGKGPVALDIKVIATVGGLPKPYDQRSYQAAAGESLADVMHRAVVEIASLYENAHKSGNVIHFDKLGELPTIVPLPGDLNGWLSVRDRLNHLSVIRGVELVSLNRGEADLIIRFAGDQGQVEAALAQSGLPVTFGDGHWTMKPSPSTSALSR